jgi:hypothetical protein
LKGTRGMSAVVVVRCGRSWARCGDHGPTLDVTACERLFDKPIDGVWASDHFGIVAELAIPGPSSTAHY